MNIRPNRPIILSILLFCGVFALAQQRDIVGLTDFPVPAWPEGGIDPEPGVMPPEHSEDYVFVDLANNEFVVAYPVSLEEEEEEEEEAPQQAQQQQQGQQQARGRGRGRGGQQAEPQGRGRGRGGRGRGGQQQTEPEEAEAEEPEEEVPVPLKLTRYELLRNVEPDVQVSVTTVDGNRYLYAYTLANAPAAEQSIDQWAMVLPGQSGGATIQGPEGWLGIVQPNRTFKLKDPDWIENGSGALWSFQRPENVVEPGDVATGFSVESQLRPGFTLGFFRQAESVGAKVATSGYVPDVVKKQMDELLVFEYNSKTVLLIGPKFDQDADAHTIAEDFIQGIFTLSRMGALNLNSDFVRTTLAELTGVEPGASSVRLTAEADTRIETEVLSALKASLGIE